MAFGTLRRDSYFTPGEVLDEARALDEAVRALSDIELAHEDVLTVDWVAGFDAFLRSWRDFWGECNAWTGWLFRAKDATRDELLNFEDQYVELKKQLEANVAGANTGSLDDPTPEGARTRDNLTQAADDAADAAGDVLSKPLRAAERIGWETIAGAAVVVSIVVAGIVVLHKKGGLRLAPVPVPL